jgi:hypothetical protein
VASIFEQRLDAYMRCERRPRATSLNVTYLHPPEGETYPKATRLERLRPRRNKLVLRATRKLPTSDPRFAV